MYVLSICVSVTVKTAASGKINEIVIAKAELGAQSDLINHFRNSPMLIPAPFLE